MTTATEEKGIIGEYTEDGLPVVMKFVDEFPSSDIRSKYRWLTVISWRYDGSGHNGMPGEDNLERMKLLEQTIENRLAREGLCLHAYSRTGNGLKELVYYIVDRDHFIESFNKALSGQPHYPLEIKFYEDEEWKDFRAVLDRFKLQGQ